MAKQKGFEKFAESEGAQEDEQDGYNFMLPPPD
jgi:hypothetical protein